MRFGIGLGGLALMVVALSACNDGSSASSFTNPDPAGGNGNTSGTHPTPTPTPTGTVTPIPVPSPTDALYDGPAEVAPFVDKFVSDGAAQGVDVTSGMKNPILKIQISSLSAYGSSVIGLCESGGNLRTVTFDPDFWNSVDDTQRELLAHHEMGHCVLGRDHRSDLLPSGAYASIMYPIIMTNETYEGDYAYYQNELFTWTAGAAMSNSSLPKIHICNQDDIGAAH